MIRAILSPRRLYDPIDRTKIPVVGRTNVANTFCDSYRTIPRPFGNAKIDFPENYVLALVRAREHTRAESSTLPSPVGPQGHIFAYTYARIGRDSALGMQRVQKVTLSLAIRAGLRDRRRRIPRRASQYFPRIIPRVIESPAIFTRYISLHVSPSRCGRVKSDPNDLRQPLFGKTIPDVS